MAAAGIFDVEGRFGGGDAVVLGAEGEGNGEGEDEREDNVGEEEGGAEVVEWGRGVEVEAGHFGGSVLGLGGSCSGECIDGEVDIYVRRMGWDETGNGSGDVMKRLMCEEEFEHSHMVMHTKRLYLEYIRIQKRAWKRRVRTVDQTVCQNV